MSGHVEVRVATEADIPRLIELNRVSYPVLAQDNITWREPHLRSHQRIFPIGQLVAEIGGKIVGASASLVVSLGKDPYRLHTWSGITDSGYFTTHDPLGDTLYGADVYVDPSCRRQGVGHALYEARRALCRKLNLRRIVAGGRLWGYSEYANQYTPDEYAYRVKSGELHDLVFSFQSDEGFDLKGILPNYLRDPKSLNFATFLEWLNPDFRPNPEGVRKVRLACVQYKMRKVKSFEDFENQVRYFADIASDYRSDFLMFPELFTMQLLSCCDAFSPKQGIITLASFTERFTELLKELAVRYGITIIGGSHPVLRDGKVYNIAFVALPDGTIVEQPKLHITPTERKWWGISGGHELKVIDTPKARIGILICYDVEFPEAPRLLADHGAEIIFVPFCTDTRQGYLRVRYCAQARAIENQVYLALAGNVGNLPDVSNLDINFAQAAVFTPSDFAFARDGIAAEADSNEETVLVCDLDLDDLHDSRTTGTVTPRIDRRPDLFQIFSPLFPQRREESILLGDELSRIMED